MYVTKDAGPRWDSRIDFYGRHYTVSGVADIPRQRARSEEGGMAKFTENDQFFSVEDFALYAPKRGVHSWADSDMACSSAPTANHKELITCAWRKTGQHLCIVIF
jgi:hypothetical protein